MTRLIFKMDIEGEGPELLERIATIWRRLDEWPASNVSYEFEEKNKPAPGHVPGCRDTGTIHTVKRDMQAERRFEEKDLNVAP